MKPRVRHHLVVLALPAHPAAFEPFADDISARAVHHAAADRVAARSDSVPIAAPGAVFFDCRPRLRCRDSKSYTVTPTGEHIGSGLW